MNNLLERIRKKQQKQPAEAQGANGMDLLLRKKTIPPHIVACKVCGGKGTKDGATCPQCKGSGRVIVSCEVTTYVSAYVPEKGLGYGI
ncbi:MULTISPECIES: hypothetical protein [Parabacteroides]|jgi:DnaJ-class molecular chaperone|uniref:hypothetical protein n=1 Tax=Parabacteroides TaxID=375288 RepID=UPI0011DE48E7|nr:MULTISPECIES: hypothetical protein [Parabacteroides]MBU9059499.1 hypothetical protein [Parabacteroides merdae]MCG4835606.1 hypothetical protein [Parabacteroides merdae]MCQ5193811.1 hypothetical protein [Parabacteroides merdae]